jgi:long-chain acyl-CoA synthetase
MNDEIERALSRRAETERLPLPVSLAALFDQAVARFGDRIFWRTVDGDGVELTYRQFAALVDRAAAALARFGVRPGMKVALALPNVPDMGAIWIALHKLGAAALGVNVNLTPSEIDYALGAAEAEILIVDVAHIALLEESDGRRLPVPRARIILRDAAIDGLACWSDLISDVSQPVAPVEVDPNGLASILYTSGSMGLPKPAMLPHSWHTVSGLVRSRQGPPPANVLIDSPLYYMGGQWRFAMAMYLGSTLCVAQKPTLNRYAQRLLEYDISLCAVSSQTAKLPDHPDYQRLNLAWVTSSGLPKDMHGPLEARLRAPVREIYGATEVGSVIVMPTIVTGMVGSGSCGLPDAFRKCRIVDTNGQDAKPGETGELWLSGPGVTLGYFGNPQATADAFAGEWYRTGDLFDRDSAGFYYWRSRIKDIIRRSKENISAVEVETAVRSLPEVLEVAALAVPDEYRDEEVKVYVQLAPGETRRTVPPERVLEHVRGLLAPYKTPRYIEYVDQFERTASNKVSKLALKRQKPDLRLGSYDSVDGVWR